MTTPERIELQILRCSACDKTFPAAPSSGKAKCSHCGEEYVHNDEGWHCKRFLELSEDDR